MNNTESIACLIQLNQVAREISARHQGRQLGGLLSVGRERKWGLITGHPTKPSWERFQVGVDASILQMGDLRSLSKIT